MKESICKCVCASVPVYIYNQVYECTVCESVSFIHWQVLFIRIRWYLGSPVFYKQDDGNFVCFSFVICVTTFATLNFGVIRLLHIHVLRFTKIRDGSFFFLLFPQPPFSLWWSLFSLSCLPSWRETKTLSSSLMNSARVLCCELKIIPARRGEQIIRGGGGGEKKKQKRKFKRIQRGWCTDCTMLSLS